MPEFLSTISRPLVPAAAINSLDLESINGVI